LSKMGTWKESKRNHERNQKKKKVAARRGLVEDGQRGESKGGGTLKKWDGVT